MNILVINAGSSSLKYQLVDMNNERAIAKGIVDRIGIKDSFVVIETNKGKHKQGFEGTDSKCPDHKVAIQQVLQLLICKQHGCINDMSEIAAIGHRVVHCGEDYNCSVRIDDKALKVIHNNIPLAPLHNPANIAGIEACSEAIPHAPSVAVFDTTFHSTLPAKAFLYGIPYQAYHDHKIRKYGFHGTSHMYVSQQARKIWGKGDFRLIVCHLGNGASLSAVHNDRCIDTSMGFTPLAGLVMGTRSGDIDPAMLQYLSLKYNYSIEECIDYLNKSSGVLGLSGISSDFRDLIDTASNGDKRATLALDVFAYRVQHYIGAYAAALNGVDMIAFTAGIGENAATVRELICSNLEYLGLNLDKSKNDNAPRGEQAEISADKSRLKIYVIPTNEELVIARETLKYSGLIK